MWSGGQTALATHAASFQLLCHPFSSSPSTSMVKDRELLVLDEVSEVSGFGTSR